MVTKANICAIIVSYNSGHIIGSCLELLNNAGVEAIVVDNASKDETIRIASENGARIVQNSKNQGFGRANNIGARNSNADWLLFVNPDLEITNDAIDALINAANKYDNIGILGPRIIESDGRLFLQARSLLSPSHLNNAGEISPNGDCSVPFLSGACMMVRRDIFESVGGFDENIFLFYEDDDLCRKIADKGFANVFVNDAIVRHGRGKSSTPQKGHIFRMRYHLAWSKIYIARKYGIAIAVKTDMIKNASKYLFASLIFNQKRSERYGGSFKGSQDALNGVSAIAKEGLP